MLHLSFEASANTVSKISLRLGDESLCRLVDDIISLAQSKRLTIHLWSLAELGLDDGDYRSLRRWGQNLSRQQVSRWLNTDRLLPGTDFTYRACFGLLFLLLASEHARREGTMGQIWPDVALLFSETNPPGNTRSFLFNPHPYPELHTLDAVREALQTFRLRNDLNNQGEAHFWMNSIYLQFGFTQTGIQNGLSNWLLMPDSRPVAIQALLDASSPCHSETFRNFWQVLMEYRHGEITEKKAVERLLASNWLLPIHLEATLKATKARPGETAVPLNGILADSSTFISALQLQWDHAEPQFSCRVEISPSLLADISTSVRMLNIYCGSETVAVLPRQEDGSFPDGRKIPLSFSQPFYEATLEGVSVGENRTEQRETIATQELILWEKDAPVTIYDLKTNELQDAEVSRMRPERPYALIIPADQEVCPLPEAQIPAAGYWRIVRLNAAWPAETSVWLSGNFLWKPVTTLQLQSRAVPDWVERGTLDNLTCCPQQVRLGEKMQVEITCVPAAKLEKARFLGHALNYEKNADGKYRTESIMLPPGLSPSQSSLNLILRNGDQTISISRPLDLSMYGLAFRRDGEWQAHAADSVLDLNAIKDLPARIAVPDKERDWKLYAGENFLRSAPFASSLLPYCIGLGESLTLRCSPRLPHIVLAPQIVSVGEIADVWFGERSRTLSVGLRSLHFPPSQEYQLVWWDFKGAKLRIAWRRQAKAQLEQ